MNGAMGREVRIVYFAWVRERIGRAEETIALPASVVTIADLIGWLAARGPGYAEAFARPSIIRAAIDRTHTHAGAGIAEASEIAFFPPVTGG
jgi:molybdopterin synthase sulfur carrier subunit